MADRQTSGKLRLPLPPGAPADLVLALVRVPADLSSPPTLVQFKDLYLRKL
jgi:hypothetical protein